jgi:hypothetical protein
MSIYVNIRHSADLLLKFSPLKHQPLQSIGIAGAGFMVSFSTHRKRSHLSG